MIPDHTIGRGLAVSAADDRFYLIPTRSRDVISLTPEQATDLRTQLDSWLAEYWQLPIMEAR